MILNSFAIIIPSYNNSKFYQKNLQSVLGQQYQNYKIIYIDDFSSDGTEKLVNSFFSSKNLKNVTLQQNTQRLGAMRNLYEAIHKCNDNDIIVTLDGDDWFAHNKVLEILNNYYNDKNTWMTWGSYMDHPGKTRGCSRPIPDQIIKSRSYRRSPWMTSHLRTFYKWLFAKIKKEDFYDPSGKFLDVASDLSFMLPMLEMSNYHGKYIHDILYVYNNENPIQDYKVKLNRQLAMDRFIRSKPIYPAL